MRKYLKLESILIPIIKNLGYNFIGIEFLSKKKKIVIFVSKKESYINVQDCEIINKTIKYILSVENYIYTDYRIEVSSIGLKPLLFSINDIKKNIGSILKISLLQSINNKSLLIGRLIYISHKKKKLYLHNKNKIILLYFYQIDKIRMI